MSLFKYKADVLHQRYNHEIPAKNFVGDGGDCCGWDVTAAQYADVTWGDVLYLGLYLGNQLLVESLGENAVYLQTQK